MWRLVPRPGIEPAPPALGAQRLNPLDRWGSPTPALSGGFYSKIKPISHISIWQGLSKNVRSSDFVNFGIALSALGNPMEEKDSSNPLLSS